MPNFPRCQILPLPHHEVAVIVEGREVTRWHFSEDSPRPFFYPVLGPSGTSLTRMGHPGAGNHDHHRSVWFAHHKVLGIDFWSENTEARIRQSEWLAYEDGEEEAILAVRLKWFDGHNPAELIDQEMIASIRPLENQEWILETQSTFHPKARQLEFGQTNFGFFAVRVAKNLSEFFGGGTLTNSEGQTSESKIFGNKASWMDYSGPVPAQNLGAGQNAWEGITYFDHPNNTGFPNRWHVREDGWMGCAPCMKAPLTSTQDEPLVLRYQLHIHRDGIDKSRANQSAEDFANRPGFVVEKAATRHRKWTARRMQV